MRILFLGDIVGEPGRKAVMHKIADIEREHKIDFSIVNGENSAGGRGISCVHSTTLLIPLEMAQSSAKQNLEKSRS